VGRNFRPVKDFSPFDTQCKNPDKLKYLYCGASNGLNIPGLKTGRVSITGQNGTGSSLSDRLPKTFTAVAFLDKIFQIFGFTQYEPFIAAPTDLNLYDI
jgi:hypothetical protein